ncbi:hypothetical protein [[Leptolyngbya] sp. PCC 7376]|uniref:hypothetical protein n=1 Tax=[Leptolyngbya] sp. PCC 7376 TaxID=111781 RepID=UPI00135AB067|nr:hypothetical protein [[Leptolyngbya] sp. PCC 7376]
MPTFDYVHVQLLTNSVTGFYDGYRTVAPVFLQPLIDLNGVITAYGSIYRANKNPMLFAAPQTPLPIVGLDISGAKSSIITLMTDDSVNN